MHPQSFAFFIGTKGGENIQSQNKGGSAGYNGGHEGAIDDYNRDAQSGGSGGSTDMRYYKSPHLIPSIYERIMVAGGGGGGAGHKGSGNGGHGGGINGTFGMPSAANPNADQSKPGTQTSGFQVFQGGSGDPGNEAGAPGGGGYWGGYGGICLRRIGGFGGVGGAGGSSYISGHKDCLAMDENNQSLGISIHPSRIYFIDTDTIVGNSTMPSPIDILSNETLGHLGNGAVRITVLKLYDSICTNNDCFTNLPLDMIMVMIFLCQES